MYIFSLCYSFMQKALNFTLPFMKFATFQICFSVIIVAISVHFLLPSVIDLVYIFSIFYSSGVVQLTYNRFSSILYFRFCHIINLTCLINLTCAIILIHSDIFKYR